MKYGPRYFMIDKRRALGLSDLEMARFCQISRTLLHMLEDDGEVTHPKIVARIKVAYGLTDEEAEHLLPLNRRPNGGDYDPDRYVERNEL